MIIGSEDLELLEQLELMRDITDCRAAMGEDAGGRVSLDELRAELNA